MSIGIRYIEKISGSRQLLLVTRITLHLQPVRSWIVVGHLFFVTLVAFYSRAVRGWIHVRHLMAVDETSKGEEVLVNAM